MWPKQHTKYCAFVPLEQVGAHHIRDHCFVVQPSTRVEERQVAVAYQQRRGASAGTSTHVFKCNGDESDKIMFTIGVLIVQFAHIPSSFTERALLAYGTSRIRTILTYPRISPHCHSNSGSISVANTVSATALLTILL